MEIKDVKDGYARNFLLPRKLAVLADAEALAKRAEIESREKKIEVTAHENLKKLENLVLEFIVKSGSHGEVFESVNSEKISKDYDEKGFKDFRIVLAKPLKSLGQHEAEVDFGRGVKGKVKVILTVPR